MRLKLPSDQISALHEALARAGIDEIGGQIFGEQLAPSHFLASELTFQKRRGTFAQFIVDLVQAARDALRFFDKTRHRYARCRRRRFNQGGVSSAYSQRIKIAITRHNRPDSIPGWNNSDRGQTQCVQ